MILSSLVNLPRIIIEPQGPLVSGHHNWNVVLNVSPLTLQTPSGVTFCPTSSRSTMPVRRSPCSSKNMSRSGKPRVSPFGDETLPLSGLECTIHSPDSVNPDCILAVGVPTTTGKTHNATTRNPITLVTFIPSTL